MRIQVNLSALGETKWHEYATRFLLGGAITVLTGLIAKKFGSVFGGLFLAFPAIFPASATLMEKHEREKKQRANIMDTIRGRQAAALDARGTAQGAIGLIAFALVVWKLEPRVNSAVTLSAALMAWFTVAFLIWRARK